MSGDPAAFPEGLPLALLLDTDDSLRRVGRIIRELGDPAGPGATPESGRAQAAIDAVLNTGPPRDPAASTGCHLAATLHHATRLLDALEHRLTGSEGAAP